MYVHNFYKEMFFLQGWSISCVFTFLHVELFIMIEIPKQNIQNFCGDGISSKNHVIKIVYRAVNIFLECS